MDPLKLSDLAKEEYCYLTTKGRVTGRPHRIEIWFGASGNSLYLLSGGGEKSDWVKNLKADPAVTVRLARQTFKATARVVKNNKEDETARHLLAAKYYRWSEGKTLNEWARTALPIAIDLEVE